MNICIVSRDKRYVKVNELLLANGYNSVLCTNCDILPCDVLILSVRDELTDTELEHLFSQIAKKTIVLCGNSKRVKEHFDGTIIDYSLNEEFLQANAYLTAEATITYLHSVIQESIQGKNIFVAGYGRIGQHLCKILALFGAKVCVYARRYEVKKLVEINGFINADLKDCINNQIIINTVPSVIFKKELIDTIPNETCVVDLASSPYGFENMECVHLASGLPGKILSNSAARVVFDTIIDILSEARKELI